jgi:hypothetical protein
MHRRKKMESKSSETKMIRELLEACESAIDDLKLAPCPEWCNQENPCRICTAQKTLESALVKVKAGRISHD